MKELLFNESALNCFTVLFHSAFDRDRVHKFKGWFCKGYGLSTFLFSPNFVPKLDDVIFFPHWVEFPDLPLEYRDPEIIELIANKMGIFIKHDLIPYEHIFRSVRVCILMSNQKPMPSNLICHSKWGVWYQKIVIQGPGEIDKYSMSLGHFNSACQGNNVDRIVVCEDHSTMAVNCKFWKEAETLIDGSTEMSSSWTETEDAIETNQETPKLSASSVQQINMHETLQK